MTFQQHEDKGREKYEAMCRIPHDYTKGQYAKWDVSATAKTDTFNIELKDRDIPYTRYADEGFLLEKIKYDALLEAYRETGSIPIYMNFFQDNVGYYWNLLDIEPVWETVNCTTTTADGTYGNKRVGKLVTKLLPVDGVRFNYES